MKEKLSQAKIYGRPLSDFLLPDQIEILANWVNENITPDLSNLKEVEQVVGGLWWVKINDKNYPDELRCCLWCRLPIIEPPYVGSMIDDDFPENYFTHYMILENEFFPSIEEYTANQK